MKEDLSLYLFSFFLSVRAEREREGNESDTGEARDSGRPFRGDPFF